MDATRLLFAITGLEPGKAIDFTSGDARCMVELDLPSRLFDCVREEDVESLMNKFRNVHGLVITKKPSGYCAYRPLSERQPVNLQS